MLIIGDVHGKVGEYFSLINRYDCDFSICVGDFGFKPQWDWLPVWINHDIHRINMGNHDYLPYLHESPFSLGDWQYSDYFELFSIRGAVSIDKHLRIEGVDWFSNEEVDISMGYEILDNFSRIKPRIVITHDCPQFVMGHLFGYSEKSRTRQLLEACFEIHQPELWIFGHHHRSKSEKINGTEFRCLAELETYEI